MQAQAILEQVMDATMDTPKDDLEIAVVDITGHPRMDRDQHLRIVEAMLFAATLHFSRSGVTRSYSHRPSP